MKTRSLVILIYICFALWVGCILMATSVALPPRIFCKADTYIEALKEEVAAHEICKQEPACFLTEKNIINQIDTRRQLAKCGIVINTGD